MEQLLKETSKNYSDIISKKIQGDLKQAIFISLKIKKNPSEDSIRKSVFLSSWYRYSACFMVLEG